MQTLLLALAVSVPVQEETVGDVTTFSHTSLGLFIGVAFGLFLLGLGIVTMWLCKFSLRNKGYWGYVMTFAGVVIPIVMFLTRNHHVILTPQQIEVHRAGSPDIIPLAQLDSITVREKLQRRGPPRKEYTFHMADGSSREYSGDLMDALVEKLATKVASERKLNLAGSKGAAPQPAALAANPPTPSAPPAVSSTPAAAPTAPTVNPTAAAPPPAAPMPILPAPAASMPATVPPVASTPATSTPALTESANVPAPPAATPSAARTPMPEAAKLPPPHQLPKLDPPHAQPPPSKAAINEKNPRN